MLHPRSLMDSLAGTAHARRLFALAAGSGHSPREPGPFHPRASREPFAESHGTSQVPGQPFLHCAFAAFSDPGRTDIPRIAECPARSPVLTMGGLQRLHDFEAPSRGFSTHCLRFDPTVTGQTQDSFPAGATLYGRGVEPPGLLQMVSGTATFLLLQA
jgi:hypothetical protein